MAEKSQTKAAAAMADDKKRAIETAMQQIERTYGKGSIMRFGDNTVSNVEAISTGSLALDLALEKSPAVTPLTSEQYNWLYDNYMPATVSNGTYEDNLKLLGDVDLTSPTSTPRPLPTRTPSPMRSSSITTAFPRTTRSTTPTMWRF